jgi:hypothetical protein
MNRHIVDQLADVRAQLKALEEREKDLKAQVSVLIDKSDVAAGDDYQAFHVISERKGGLDDKAMIAAGIDIEKFRKASSIIISIRLSERTAPVVA